MNPEKPKIAFYWCASCGGCEEAVVDIAEAILDIVASAEIVFWPVALDFKRKDVEAMPDCSIRATFLNGAIRTSEQEEMAHLLRRKSQLLVAFGSCSHLGGIPGLANLFQRDSILRAVYLQAATLDQVVPVDYYVPGCPPQRKIVVNAVSTLLDEHLPAKRSVLAPEEALCTE